MKNQYVGDVGDYGKYALLRELSRSYSIGVNWYLTRDDDKPDGKFTKYLLKDNSNLDIELFQKLKGLLYPDEKNLCQENRCISNIESGNFIPNATFFNEVLDYVAITDRKTYRDEWIKCSLERLGDKDIIFLDPDNGLEVKTVPPTRKYGNKYVTYDEARSYYSRAKVALVIYNHRDHSSENDYINRFLQFYELEGTRDSFLYRLTFRKESVRDYVFVTKPKYHKEIGDFIHAFACPARVRYFRYSELPIDKR